MSDRSQKKTQAVLRPAIVVTRCGEDIGWLESLRDWDVTVYDKGDPAAAEPLPNYGRHTDAVLYHIVTRYDALAPLTVFCQANPFDHQPAFLQSLRALPGDTAFAWVGDQVFFAGPDGGPHHRGLPIARLWADLFPGVPCPERLEFGPGESFAVACGRIRQRPRHFYARLRALQTVYGAKWDYTVERLWHSIFAGGTQS